MRQVGVVQRSAMDEPEAVLGQFGWQVKGAQLGDDAANYGRCPLLVAPRSLPNLPRRFFVIAQRLDR
jgi:hypothetical protein